jgi:hypothetical protein
MRLCMSNALVLETLQRHTADTLQCTAHVCLQTDAIVLYVLLLTHTILQ